MKKVLIAIFAFGVYTFLLAIVVSFLCRDDADKNDTDVKYDIIGHYIGSIMNSDGIRTIDVYVCGNDTIYNCLSNGHSISVK